MTNNESHSGTTKPAGEGLSDEEFVAEVDSQTDPNLEVEEIFEREADGVVDDRPAAELEEDEDDNVDLTLD